MAGREPAVTLEEGAPSEGPNAAEHVLAGGSRSAGGYPQGVFDPQMDLLLTSLASVVGDGGDEGGTPVGWSEARAALEACGEVEDDVAQAVAAQDLETLRAILEQWYAGTRHLLVHDRDVLKRAMKAYRKSLKVTVLAAESSLGGGPMSSGRKSMIVGIRPPDRYPRAVWQELVRQGRLLDAKQGIYELPAE